MDINKIKEEILGNNKMEEREAEEAAKETVLDGLIQITLKEMELPASIFDSDASINWLNLLLDKSSASDGTKDAIRNFSKRLDNTFVPKSAIDVTAFHNDKDRTSWHTHCEKIDDIWKTYLAGVVDILDDDTDFDLSTMAKPSGPLGAAMHIQWHYPVDIRTRVGHQFRHVLDPHNMSLLRQLRKIATRPMSPSPTCTQFGSPKNPN